MGWLGSRLPLGVWLFRYFDYLVFMLHLIFRNKPVDALSLSAGI